MAKIAEVTAKKTGSKTATLDPKSGSTSKSKLASKTPGSKLNTGSKTDSTLKAKSGSIAKPKSGSLSKPKSGSTPKTSPISTQKLSKPKVNHAPISRVTKNAVTEQLKAANPKRVARFVMQNNITGTCHITTNVVHWVKAKRSRANVESESDSSDEDSEMDVSEADDWSDSDEWSDSEDYSSDSENEELE